MSALRLGEHHFLGLINPDVNLNRMHQLYIVVNTIILLIGFKNVDYFHFSDSKKWLQSKQKSIG